MIEPFPVELDYQTMSQLVTLIVITGETAQEIVTRLAQAEANKYEEAEPVAQPKDPLIVVSEPVEPFSTDKRYYMDLPISVIENLTIAGLRQSKRAREILRQIVNAETVKRVLP